MLIFKFKLSFFFFPKMSFAIVSCRIEVHKSKKLTTSYQNTRILKDAKIGGTQS